MKQMKGNKILDYMKSTAHLWWTLLITIIVFGSIFSSIFSKLGLSELWSTALASQLSILIYGLYLIDFDYKYLIDRFKGRFNIKSVFSSLKLLALILLVNITLGQVFKNVSSDTTNDVVMSGSLLLKVLFPVVIAPIAEEITFRVGLKSKLVDKGVFSEVAFILLGGLTFGLLHWQPGVHGIPIIIITGAIGIVNGIAYVKTDNVLVPTMGHMAYNAIIISLASMV